MGWVGVSEHRWECAGNIGTAVGVGIGWKEGYGWELKGGKTGEADRGHLGCQSLHVSLLSVLRGLEARRDRRLRHASLPKSQRLKAALLLLLSHREISLRLFNSPFFTDWGVSHWHCKKCKEIRQQVIMGCLEPF